MVSFDKLVYDPTSESGLRWKHSQCNQVAAGSVAGTLSKCGYYSVKYFGKLYKAHRIVAVLCGVLQNIEDPRHIDHIDGDRANNVVGNMRAVDQRTNNQNTLKHRAGKLPGAKRTPSGRWQSRIKVAGAHIYLGTFDTEEAAHTRYLEAVNGLRPK